MQNMTKAGADGERRPGENTGARQWLLLALVAVIAVLCVAVLAIGTSRFFQYLQGPCPFPCTDERLTVTQWMRAHQAGISPRTYAAVFVVLQLAIAAIALGTAAVLIWRRPRDRMAYLVAAATILLGTTYSEVNSLANRNQFVLAPLGNSLETLGIIAWLLLLYVFPNGRFALRGMRWLMLISTGLVLLMRSQYSGVLSLPFWLAISVLAIPPLAGQAIRYRRVYGAVEQQQVKWAAYGIVMALAANLLSTLAGVTFVVSGGVAPAVKLAMEAVAYLGVMLLPLTLAAAVLRYRLFDINVIIRRTLQYAIVALLLTITYTGLVTILQGALWSFTRRGDSLSVVLATLVIAALFNPLRQRVQIWVDRRFYRSVYHSEEVVASFGRMAQNEGDLNLLTEEMLDAVRSAVQPTFATLWLAQQSRSHPEDRGQ